MKACRCVLSAVASPSESKCEEVKHFAGDNSLGNKAEVPSSFGIGSQELPRKDFAGHIAEMQKLQ
jgi:hypothetical protein